MLDMQAIKPGNVGFHADAHDLCANEFLRSADVSAMPLTDTSSLLGERIFNAIQATHHEVGTNTNLGMVLLIAPLVQAFIERSKGEGLTHSLAKVLSNTTIEDAKLVYKAVRLAQPGGMGVKDFQDVSQEPSVSLLKAMEIAASWDRIAGQYSNNFCDVFGFGCARFEEFYTKWQDERWATTGLFLSYLAKFTDSLIERKHGMVKAKEINDMILPLEKELSSSGTPRRYESQLLEIDGHLKRNRINPGTTADLTVATIFAVAVMQL